MSRRTLGLLALLATGVLVTLLLAWWARAHGPGGPTASPSLSTETLASSPHRPGRPVAAGGRRQRADRPQQRPAQRIDFILADDSWLPTVMATWRSAVSDHRGVVGRLLLRSPRVCR